MCAWRGVGDVPGESKSGLDVSTTPFPRSGSHGWLLWCPQGIWLRSTWALAPVPLAQGSPNMTVSHLKAFSPKNSSYQTNEKQVPLNKVPGHPCVSYRFLHLFSMNWNSRRISTAFYNIHLSWKWIWRHKRGIKRLLFMTADWLIGRSRRRCLKRKSS